MPLLLGTRSGVYRCSTVTARASDRLLETDGQVYGLARVGDGWYVASAGGLYRSSDLDEWTSIDLPQGRTTVTAVAGHPGGGRLYAGTMPAELYLSDDGGRTWRESAGFRGIDSSDRWWNPDVTPHVRTFSTHPEVPDRLVLGIDGGGVHVSDDRGETWSERRGGIVNFLHDVIAIGPDEYVAATDAGLFWTADGGYWWDYLYGDETEHRYFRGVFRDGRTIYSGGSRSHPPVWDGERGADAGFYCIQLESPPDDRPADRTIEVKRVNYPGEPREIVLSGTVLDGQLVAGTNTGRMLHRAGDEWTTGTTLPVETQIRCMYAY